MTIPIYVINLDRDTERLAGMERRLRALGLPFQRFPAYRGHDIPERWQREFEITQGETWLTDGEVGCYASHLGVLALFAATGQPLALVLEDDVEFGPGFTRILDNIDNFPDRLDILRLSNPATGIRIKTGTIANGIEIVKYWDIPETTGAYIVSRSEARKIIGNDKLRFLPYDHAIGEGAYIFGLNSFGIHPAPVWPTEARSSIDREGQRPEGRDKTRLQSIARPRLIRHPLMYTRKFFHRMKEFSLFLYFRYKLRKRKIRHFQRNGTPINESMFLIEYGSGYALKNKQIVRKSMGERRP